MSNWLSDKIDLRGLQAIILHILVLTLPFSVEIALPGNTRMFFPTEPLMVLLALILFIDLLIRPGSLHDLLPRNTRIILPFIVALLVGTIFSVMKVISLKFTAVNLLYILIFFFTLHRHIVLDPGLFKRLISLYSIGFLAITIFAVYQYSQYEWNPVVVKAIFKPFYKDHTIFGATAALLSAYWLSTPQNGKLLMPLIINRTFGLLLAGAVLLSYSRAAMLSVLVFLSIYILIRMRIRLWQMGIVVGILLIYLIINIQGIRSSLDSNRHDSGDRQADLVDHTLSAGNINTDVSNRERLNRWVAGLSMFSGKPLTGFGPGTYQFTYIPYQDTNFMTRLSLTDPWHIPENSGGTAHSEYILALSEMGITGALAWVILIGGLIRMAFKKTHHGSQDTLALIGFAVISTYLFHAFFNNFLNTDKFAFLFWGIIAWMSASSTKNLTDDKRFLHAGR